jgi:2,3-dihydroxybiphenyl 1,2-dioxygenase
MNEIRGLGYIGVEVSDVDAYERFATGVLGVELARREDDGTIHLRWDEYASRMSVRPGALNDVAYAGWEVGNAGELQSLAARLNGAGVIVTPESPEHAQRRGVRELISFRDPDGLLHEAFYGPLLLPERPFHSPRGIGGFVTGDQGCGHLVLGVADPDAQIRFLVDLLGFRISDYIDVATPMGPFHLTFLHCSSRHHAIAIARRFGPEPRLHHVMLEVNDLDDVGSTYYLAQEHGHPIAMSIGRHTNDHMLSFYVQTPAGFLIEYGWGGLQVDDATWHVRRYEKTSVWGHVSSRRPGPPVPAEAAALGAAR